MTAPTNHAGSRQRVWEARSAVEPVAAAIAAGGTSTMSRADLEPLVIELVAAGWPPCDVHRARASAARCVRKLLDWLVGYPGDSWTQRWQATGADVSVAAWEDYLGPPQTQGRGELQHAMDAMLVLRAIVPSFEWVIAAPHSRLWWTWTTYHDAELFAVIRQLLEVGTPAYRVRTDTIAVLARICLCHQKTLRELTREDFLTNHRALLRLGRKRRTVHAAWTYARQAGMLAGEPDDFTMLLGRVQLSPAELVDRYGVTDPAIRALFIDYLTERQPSCDYGWVKTMALVLVKLFWCDLQQHYPGQCDLALSVQQAREWRARVGTLPNGKPRRDMANVTSVVRGFYSDLSAWAHEEPARWASWVRPCPFNGRESRGLNRRERHRNAAEMAARTRTLTGVLPQLLASISGHLAITERRFAAAAATAMGESFELDGEQWRIPPSGRGHLRYTRSRLIAIDPSGQRVDLTVAEDRAFWTWAAVEVFRNTGVRLEELLELTHLSIRPFRKPDGQIVPLLQIAPSKTDTERVLPVSPQLAHALSRIINRHLATVDDQSDARQPALPLVSRRDSYELTYSAPMPFLFQRRLGNGRRAVINPHAIGSWLERACQRADLRDTDGSLIRFTPHDFRRLFLTDIVANGVPIHIAAQLAGHEDINTTRGYLSIYPTEVFAAYDNYLARRRAERPAEEYRDPTAAELTEFAEHFGRRRVELGDCVRPYGTGCTHEHACLRCNFLQVSPDRAPTLDVIETDLQHRIAQAEQQAWLGDVDQLQLTLTHLHSKKDQLNKLIATTADRPLQLPVPDSAVPGRPAPVTTTGASS